MKSKILPATAAILGLALFCTQAFAEPVQVDIPFTFVIGGKVLPAARYIVEVAGGTQPGVLSIRTMESGAATMFDTSQMPEKADPKNIELVFDTVGDKTYLTEVWGVVDSGRAVKHMVDGHALERAPDASRRRLAAVRVVNEKEKKGGN